MDLMGAKIYCAELDRRLLIKFTDYCSMKNNNVYVKSKEEIKAINTHRKISENVLGRSRRQPKVYFVLLSNQYIRRTLKSLANEIYESAESILVWKTTECIL